MGDGNLRSGISSYQRDGSASEERLSIGSRDMYITFASINQKAYHVFGRILIASCIVIQFYLNPLTVMAYATTGRHDGGTQM